MNPIPSSSRSVPAMALALCGMLLPVHHAAAQSETAAVEKNNPAPQVPMPQGPIEVNGIAAIVNGRVITRNQVSFLLAPFYAQLVAQYPRRGPQFETKFKEAKKNIMDELIDREIILDEFKTMGATIKPYAVDEEVKRQKGELFNGDETKFREELKRSRLTMDGYREMTREKLIVQAMRSQQFSDAPPPLPNEVQAEYNEIKNTLRDTSKDKISFQKIFIPAGDPENPLATPDSQLALAEEIVNKLAKGADFAELAKEHSRDAFAEDGGLQENIPREDLASEFAAILFDSKEGQIVGPLLDRQGFTIVKPTKLMFGPAPALSGKVREGVEQRVRSKKTSAQYERWIKDKRARASIRING